MIRSPFRNGFAQPQIGALVNPGHPLGAHLVAGWVMREHARDIITGRPLTDSFGTGPDFVETRTGEGQTFAEGAGGFPAAGNSRLDGLAENFSVVMASTPSLANGWIIYRNDAGAWSVGSAGSNYSMRMRKKDTADYEYAAGLTAGQRYTLGWTHENSTVDFYVDGIQKSTAAAAANFSANTSATEIGDHSGSGEKWTGNVEFLYVFNIPLRADDMALLHQDPYCILRPTDPLWRFSLLNAAAGGSSIAAISAHYHLAGGLR